MRAQANSDSLGFAVDVERLIKFRMENHPGSAQYAVFGNSDVPRLNHGPRGAADHILVDRSNPEVWRIVCDVRQYCDVRDAGPYQVQRFTKRAVVVRDQRNDQIRTSTMPVSRQYPDLRTVGRPNHA